MSKRKYFSQYKSPNIVIVPTDNLCYQPSPKRLKMEIPPQHGSPQHVVSFLDDFNVDEIVEYLKNCDDENITQDHNINKINKPSQQPNKQELIVSMDENLTNIVKRYENIENSDGKSITSELTTQNITFDNEIRDKNATKKSINSKNTNIRNDGSDSIQILPKNSQSMQNFNENDTIQSKCIETENDEKNTAKETKLHNTEYPGSQKNEACGNKANTLIKDNKETTENESILSPKLPKTNINKYTQITKRFVKYKADIIMCKNLEHGMFYYLRTKYSVESIIRYGKFSKIFKCKDYAGRQWAVKMLNNLSDTYILGIKKYKMLKDIKIGIPKENLFCVYVRNTFSFNGHWCFLMEFYPKNLKQALMESQKPFHIDLVQDLARQLVAAVTLLRYNNIIHSDINPSHILLNSTNTILKLCGFDGSYYIHEADISPNIGTVNYRSPEVILGYSAGFSIDIWAAALVLHEMATGRKLFPGYFDSDILYKQMCTLGDIPLEMLNQSYYRTLYFIGRMFKKKIGIIGQKTLLMHKFNKNGKVSRSVYGAYYAHWAPFSTQAQKTKDLQKIRLFLELLDKMLVLFPINRMEIEFVYMNPFIYEMYDS